MGAVGSINQRRLPRGDTLTRLCVCDTYALAVPITPHYFSSLGTSPLPQNGWVYVKIPLFIQISLPYQWAHSIDTWDFFLFLFFHLRKKSVGLKPGEKSWNKSNLDPLGQNLKEKMPDPGSTWCCLPLYFILVLIFISALKQGWYLPCITGCKVTKQLCSKHQLLGEALTFLQRNVATYILIHNKGFVQPLSLSKESLFPPHTLKNILP